MTGGTIIVSGALANKPSNGGEAWVRLNWVLGFKALGFNVCFVEQIAREACVDVDGVTTGFACCVNRAYFEKVVADFGLSDSASLIYDDGAAFAGLGRSELSDIAAEAELLVNISGHLTLEPVFQRVRRRAYIDIDPGFTQFWHAEGNRGARLEGHDFYFTIGGNIGTASCSIPTGGITWRTTRPPVVLDEWPVCRAPAFDRFSTVASWRGPFGVVEFGGQTFGLKVHEFRKFIELPQRSGLPFELALNIHPADHKDREALTRHGWQIANPSIAAEPDGFREYIQRSSAEFSVAQGIYVQTGSGWFSDRTAVYLASGKPALVQDTGFSRNLPTGEGLVAFRTLSEAVAGAESIAGDYPRHSRAARQIAEEYFDSSKVLRQLLAEIDL